MQKSGYEAAQLPLGGGGPAGGGGGGAGGPWHVAPLKPTTGCSSMPFGATPVWPWIWSKKATAVIVAVPLSLLNEPDGAPHAATKALRACRIFVLAFGVAPAVQVAAGNSAIIVWPLLRGSAITRWMSLSSSSFISTSDARTRYVVCSMPWIRLRLRYAGAALRRSARTVAALG